MNGNSPEIPEQLAGILKQLQSSDLTTRTLAYGELEDYSGELPPTFCKQVIKIAQSETDPRIDDAAGRALQRVHEALRQANAKRSRRRRRGQKPTDAAPGQKPLDEPAQPKREPTKSRSRSKRTAAKKRARSQRGSRPKAGGQTQPRSKGSMGLGKWMWLTFKKQSAITDAFGEDHKRDEITVAIIKGYVSNREFPHAKLKRFPEYSNGAISLLTDLQYKAFCFVGRPILQGEDVEVLLRYCRQNLADDPTLSDAPLSHFYFPAIRRPADLPRGQLDPERYHKMFEQISADEHTQLITTEDDEYRYDYGIVQRFRLILFQRVIDIIICAGISSLGTQAAGQFAAENLFLTDVKGSKPLIHFPDDFDDNATMEALIKVAAKKTPGSWDNLEIKLSKLYLSQAGDERMWHKESASWLKAPPGLVKVYPDRLDLHYVGKTHPLPKTSEIGRLAWAMAVHQQSQPGKFLTVTDLTNHSDVWLGHASRSDRNRTQNQITNLQTRFFGPSLYVDAQEIVRLTCPIIAC